MHKDVGDVGVMVTGGQNRIHLRVVTKDDVDLPQMPEVEEREFKKLTGMTTSAPQRVALRRLLREDVTCRMLRVIWNRDLHLIDDRFKVVVRRWVPWFSAGMTLCWGGLGVCFMWLLTQPGFKPGPTLLLWGWFSIMLVIVGFLEFLPYVIARRVEPVAERVNAELPALMAEWREAQA